MQTKCGDGSVMICGRAGGNAEVRRVGEKNSVLTKFSVCVGERNVDGQNQAVWVNCTCWNDMGKAASAIKKGDYVFAVGRIQKNTYTARDGTQKENSELNCEFVTAILKELLPNIGCSDGYAANLENSNTYIPYDEDLPF